MLGEVDLFLLYVVFFPELGVGLVGTVEVTRIFREAEAFESGESAEELEVLRAGRKGDDLELLALRQRRDVGQRGAVIELRLNQVHAPQRGDVGHLAVP